MDTLFNTFWHLYAPQKQFANRYRACEQLWAAKDEPTRELIIRTYQRRTPVSEKELAARQRFANVSAEVKRRMEAGDTRRRGIIFKEVYAERKAVDSKNIESASKASRKHPEGKC